MIGDQLKQLRTMHRLDQPQFAAIADTSKQYVSQIESGRNKIPNPFFLLRWAKHFGVRLEWIIDRELPMEPASHSSRLDVDILTAALEVSVDSKGGVNAEKVAKAYELEFERRKRLASAPIASFPPTKTGVGSEKNVTDAGRDKRVVAASGRKGNRK